MLDSSAYFAYIHEYFEIARNAARTSESQRVHEILEAIKQSNPTSNVLPDAKDTNGELLPSGYLPERRLLWIRYSELKRICAPISPKFAQEFSDPTQPFIRDTTALAQKYDCLSVEQRAILSSHLPNQYSQHSWAVLVGSDKRTRRQIVLWIGLTRDLSLAHIPIEQRWLRLLYPVRRFTDATAPEWVRAAQVQASLVQASHSTFTRAARDMITCAPEGEVATKGDEMGSPRIRPINASVDAFEGTTPLDLRLVWYASPDAITPEREDLLAAAESHAGHSEEIIVATAASYEEGAAALQPLLNAPAMAGAAVRILDADGCCALLGSAPWLWSKHFGADAAFRVIKVSDEKRLAAALLPNGLSSSEGTRIASAIDHAVTIATADFAATRLNNQNPTGDDAAASVLSIARHIDAIIQEHRDAQHPDTTLEVVRDAEQWAQRLQKPTHDPLTGEPYHFWRTLRTEPLGLQTVAAAWYAYGAEEPTTFQHRLNATLRHILFHDRLPVLDSLERPEVQILPTLPRVSSYHRAQDELLRHLGKTDDSDEMYTRMNEYIDEHWWNGAIPPGHARDLQETSTLRDLLRQPYLILGRHGQGVKTSLYQIIRRLHPDATVVTLAPDLLNSDATTALTHVIDHLLSQGDVVAVGVCDADTPAQVRRVQQNIRAWQTRFGGGTHWLFVRVGLYYSVTPPSAAFSRGIRPITLGELHTDYVEALAQHVTATLGITVEEGALRELEAGELTTPHDVVQLCATLPTEQFTVAIASEGAEDWHPDRWGQRASALRDDVSREYDLLILQVIISLAYLDGEDALTYLVRRIVDDFSPSRSTEWRFRETLFRLARTGWLPDYESVHLLNPPLLRCLHPQKELGNATLAVISWLLLAQPATDGEESFSLEYWRKLLTAGATYAAEFRESALVKRIAARVAPTLTRESEQLLVLVQALMTTGQLRDAELRLRKFRGEPAHKRGLMLSIADQCLRFRSVEPPECFLDLLHEVDDEGLATIAQRHADHLAASLVWLAQHARTERRAAALRRLAAAIDHHAPNADPSFDDRVTTAFAKLAQQR